MQCNAHHDLKSTFLFARFIRELPCWLQLLSCWTKMLLSRLNLRAICGHNSRKKRSWPQRTKNKNIAMITNDKSTNVEWNNIPIFIVILQIVFCSVENLMVNIKCDPLCKYVQCDMGFSAGNWISNVACHLSWHHFVDFIPIRKSTPEFWTISLSPSQPTKSSQA